MASMEIPSVKNPKTTSTQSAWPEAISKNIGRIFTDEMAKFQLDKNDKR